MTRLTSLTLIGLFFFVFNSTSQRAIVALGEENKTKLTTSYAFVKGKATDMVKLTLESHQQRALTPTLTIYNKRLEVLKEKELPQLDNKTAFNKLVSMGNKLYFFTSQYNKNEKNTSFFCQPINIETLEPEGSPLSIAKIGFTKLSFDNSFQRNDGSLSNVMPEGVTLLDQLVADYTLSPDSSKLMIAIPTSSSEQEQEKYYVAAYSNAMTKLWDKTIELPYECKSVDIQGIAITDNGEICLAVKHYETINTNGKIEKYGKNPTPYSMQVFVFEKDKPAHNNFTLNTEGNFIHSLTFSNNKNNLSIFGLYQQKAGENIQGFFTASINAEEKPSLKLTAFPEDLLTQVKADKQSDGKAVAGLGDNFDIVKTVERENGSTDYLLEFYDNESRTHSWGSSEMPMTSNNSYYIYGDIIDVNISGTDGKVNYTKIPRYQVCQNYAVFGSLQAMAYKDKLLVLFNDHEENIDKKVSDQPRFPAILNSNYKGTVLHMATIDGKGDMKRMLINNPDEKKLISVNSSTIIDKNTIAVNAFTGFIIGKGEVATGTITVK